MVAGHLQEKKGIFYIVLSYKDPLGTRKSKWISTGLPIKGNKKKAEAMLMEARKNFDSAPVIIQDEIMFTDFLVSWLEMVKSNIELTTYSSYSNGIHKKIVPFFAPLGLKLTEVQPRHIQEFYQHELSKGVTANTVIHYHANIRKALQYAVKADMIISNPADKIERPKVAKYHGSFYDSTEMNRLFEAVKGEKIELAILFGAFYGLRRSEIIGLKWSAIDFHNKSITIRNIVTETNLDGKLVVVEKDRTKTKASHRTLPLIPQFEEVLRQRKSQQEEYIAVCKRSYNRDYLDYIFVDEMGDRIKPGFLTTNFKLTLNKYGLRRIRFHDLRHSCASLLLASGVSMKQIQEWLGHSDFSTTANIYAHLDYSSKLSSASAMSDCLMIRSPAVLF